MAAIGPRNTRPELIVRKLLHGAGFRFRLHRKELPGRPDIVLRKWNAIIEVQGCFWHAHDCHLFKQPTDNAAFWSEKHRKNVERDTRNAKAIANLGWRRLVVWECAIKGRSRLEPDELAHVLVRWLTGSRATGEVAGTG
jgi:DNA mismatch endonuclease, patch repair protein